MYIPSSYLLRRLTHSQPAAFALSSGTIGAAMSAALSRKRAIALSYGTFLHPTPKSLSHPAHQLSAKIISQLWYHWGTDPIGIRGDGEVDLYNVNIPMVYKLLSEEGVGVTWSTMWRNSYGRLFMRHRPGDTAEHSEVPAAGPDADAASEDTGTSKLDPSTKDDRPLIFRFSPDIMPLVRPSLDELPEGTDAWAVHSDLATVTPLRAAFAEPPADVSMAFSGETVDQTTKVKYWKLKL